jgi:uncharacterized cupin superfamily protein
MSEARLVESEDGGLVPEGDGWFVLNARDARWLDGDLGKYVGFEGPEARFPQLGINLNVMQPGEPMTMYHRENAQEDFLVLAGECVLIVDGRERPLRRWDFFHCPAGVDHAIVGAGDGLSVVLAVGARTGAEVRGEHGLVYPAEPAAQKHGAAPDFETRDPKEAYAKFSVTRGPYRDGWLPD